MVTMGVVARRALVVAAWVLGGAGFSMPATAWAQSGESESAPDDSQPAGAGELEAEVLGQMSLEDLLQIEIGVASTDRRSPRDAPSIVTVLTGEEIRNAGVRDLTDILLLIPGMFPAGEVFEIISVGVRGNWAGEGKILILLDGMPYNDLQFGSLAIGSRVPVDAIERVEVIRGPGSAMYGGFAELGVINIITRAEDGENHWHASTAASIIGNEFGRLSGGASIDRHIGDLRLTLGANVQRSIRSDRTFTQIDGASYDLSETGGVFGANVRLGLDYQGLEVQLLFDEYQLEYTSVSVVLPGVDPEDFPAENRFRTYYGRIAYTWDITESFALRPEISLLQQDAWKRTDRFARVADSAIESWRDLPALRLYGEVRASVRFGDDSSLHFGPLFYNDWGIAQPDLDPSTMMPFDPITDENGEVTDLLSFWTAGFFAEVNWMNPWVNVTAGARYEHNEVYGSFAVPRLTLTKTLGDFHAKGLFAMAFRNPALRNITTNPDIERERTLSFELEAGYRFTDDLMLTVNAYDIRIDDTIVFGVEGDIMMVEPTYINAGTTGTRGVEADFRWHHDLGYLISTYSYYHRRGTPVDQFRVPPNAGDPSRPGDSSALLLGFPAHKITLNSSFEIAPGFRASAWFVYMSRRFNFEQTLTEFVAGDSRVEQVDDEYLLNLVVSYAIPTVEELSVTFGVYDVLGSDLDLPQAYDVGNEPLPVRGREFLLRLTYRE